MTFRFRMRLAAAVLMLSASVMAATPPADPKQDEKRAAELRLKADKGDGDAALQIGYMLALGRIPAPRYGTPILWFKKGCTARSLAACHNAGVSYESGKNGANQDYSEAASYFLEAAERAFLPSMYNLAVLAAESKISSLDNREGLKWMLVAQKSAVQCPDNPSCKIVTEDQKGYRAKLEDRLSAKERREAYQLAQDWRPRN